MTQRIFFLLTMVLFGGVVAYGQQPVDSMVNTYGRNFPQEKVYLHFDKPVYSAGETIWFKGYIFSGIFPSKISYNFYVEMIDPNSGDVLQRKMYPIFEGTTAGNIDLPENFELPAVIIRGYTPWMLNFDEGFLFTKKIKIISPHTPLTTEQATLPPSLSFMPEGGNFIANISNNIAFKGIDHFGDPIQFNGEIKDSKGEIVAEILPEHDGMGKVSFIPAANEQYTATWRDADKKTYTTPLPSVSPFGANLHLLPVTDDQITFRVERSPNTPENFKTLNIIAHFNQQVIYKAKLNLEQITAVGGKIPVDQVPTGVVTVSLFDADWKPIAERISFINAEDYNFTVRVNPVDKDLRKRAYNSLVVEVPEEMAANMSISVTDASASTTGPDDDNILSRLLMTGDLKGKIYAPYYYFLGNDEFMREQLDLVMLTNGWRRYDWEKLVAGKFPEIKVPNEEYLSLKATLSGLLPSQVPANAQLNVYLVLPDSTKDILILPYENQQFIEKGLIFYDTVQVYYQFNKDPVLASRASVNFTTNTYRGPLKLQRDSSWFVPLPLDTALLNRNKFFADELAKVLADSRRVQVLDAVTVRANPKSRLQELDETYTSGLFSGGDAYQFNIMDEPAAMAMQNIFQFLQGRVAGLQITVMGGNVSMTWRGQTPTLFLNEMQMDANGIMNIPVPDIAYVKVLRPPFFGAPGGGAGGAIAIYTRRGSERPTDDIPSNLLKTVLYGYSAAKQFYSPDYSTKSDLHDREDVRSTLYWNPYILTDADNRRFKVEFYNNDYTRSYRVVLEGVTPEGKITRVERIVSQ